MELRSRRWGWYVLSLLAGLNFINYATRNVVVTMYPDLRVAFSFDDIQLGWLSSSFMFAHALMNIPFGWLADRYDRRRMLAIGATLWSLGNLGSIVADGFEMMVAARILAGIGTASCVPIANALLCDVFPPERKARTVAVLNIGLFLGGGAGIVMGNQLGFPGAFIAVALPGFLLAGLVAVLPVPPLPTPTQTFAEPTSSTLWHDALVILTPLPMRLMICGGICAAFAAGGYLAWFADFLERAKGFEPEEAMITLGALGFSGGLLGVITGAAVADRLMTRHPAGRLVAIAIGFAAAVPCALISIYSPRGWLFYVSGWLLMFFINWYHGPMAAAVDDLVDDRRASLAQAVFISLMHLIGTSSAPVLIGALVPRLGIQHVMAVPVLALVFAAMFFALARPRRGAPWPVPVS